MRNIRSDTTSQFMRLRLTAGRPRAEAFCRQTSVEKVSTLVYLSRGLDARKRKLVALLCFVQIGAISSPDTGLTPCAFPGRGPTARAGDQTGLHERLREIHRCPVGWARWPEHGGQAEWIS